MWVYVVTKLRGAVKWDFYSRLHPLDAGPQPCPRYTAKEAMKADFFWLVATKRCEPQDLERILPREAKHDTSK
jgi:hypothetical protein